MSGGGTLHGNDVVLLLFAGQNTCELFVIVMPRSKFGYSVVHASILSVSLNHVSYPHNPVITFPQISNPTSYPSASSSMSHT